MGRKSSIINLTAEDREYLEMQTRARTIQAQRMTADIFTAGIDFFLDIFMYRKIKFTE